VIAAVAVLGALASLLLLLETKAIHSSAVSLGEAIESIRIAEESQVALLLYSRSRDPLVRRGLASDLEELLASARKYANTPEENALLDDAQARLARYMSGNEGDPALLEAFADLDKLTDINVEQAHQTERKSTQIDERANAIEFGFTALLLSLIAAGGLALRSFAIKPLRLFGDALHSFGAGETSVRAPESGPSEIKEAAERFNQMADALEQQRARQLAFLGGVAHDLRNPLAALKTATALWAPGHPALAPEKTAATMGVVRRQLDRLDRMVGDLLDAARIEAGRFELRLEDHDLAELSKTSFELFRSASPNHTLELAAPEGQLVARCDAYRIEQVLNNLLSNAIKYSPKGGTVKLTLERRDTWAALTVSDQGIGIAPEDLRLLFQPFSRTGASRESIPGVGLGLYIVRMIVVAHGGRIEVDSKPGVGSAFTVLLPLAGPESPGAEQART
jgi:signal transduction histidine kinase